MSLSNSGDAFAQELAAEPRAETSSSSGEIIVIDRRIRPRLHSQLPSRWPRFGSKRRIGPGLKSLTHRRQHDGATCSAISQMIVHSRATGKIEAPDRQTDPIGHEIRSPTADRQMRIDGRGAECFGPRPSGLWVNRRCAIVDKSCLRSGGQARHHRRNY